MAYTDYSWSWNIALVALYYSGGSVAVCQLACLPFSSLSLSLCLRLRSSVALPPSCQSGRASLRLYPCTSWWLSASPPSRRQELCQCDGRACLPYKSCSSSCDVTSCKKDVTEESSWSEFWCEKYKDCWTLTSWTNNQLPTMKYR